jgi:enterochelin esterase family protein
MECGRLSVLQQEMAQHGSVAVDAFWQEVEGDGAPVVERTSHGMCNVTFVWRDQGQTSVHIIQDFGADGILEHEMARLPDSDIWHLTRQFPSDTRTTYQIAPNPLPPSKAGGFPYVLDPMNPRHVPLFLFENGESIPISACSLPDAPPQPWLEMKSPAGSVHAHTMESDGRRIWVYTPVMESADCSLLVLLDGRLAKDLALVPRMLDHLIAQRRIAPTVALFVDTPDRDELLCSPDFAAYLSQDVVPWAHNSLPVASVRERTFLHGTSFGGLCALHTALLHANVFGNVLSQSGWFRWHPAEESEHLWLARQVIAQDRQSLRVYMDVGMLETARMKDGGPSQLAANRHMRDVLRAKGYEVDYREYHGGHDNGSLVNPLFDALAHMLAV